MCLFDLYVILGQTTPALQSDSALGEFVFESFNILLEDEIHQKSRNEHIWENSATETFKIKGKSNSAHFSLLQRIASLTAPELRVYHAQFSLALPYEQGFFLA